MCIGVDLVLCDREPGLKSSDLKICVGGVGDDGDPCAGLFGFRGLRLVGRGVGAAPPPAEQVDLPARRGADGVLPLVATIPWEAFCHGAERALQALALSGGRRVEI